MTTRVAACLLAILISVSATTAAASSFTGSDFELIVVGYDSLNPDPQFDEVTIDYEVWVTNNSSQTIVFGNNLIGGWLATTSIEAEINGVHYRDSDAYSFSFNAVANNYGNGVIAPGESYYMGGLFFAFETNLLPDLSVVELTYLAVVFTNSLPNDSTVLAEYDGDPLVNTITVPVPGVGLALVPLLGLMRFFGRNRGSRQA